MSQDIQKYRQIVESAHTVVKKPLTETTRKTARTILESVQGKKVTKDQLFSAVANHPKVNNWDTAIQVLQEMKSKLRASKI